MAEFVAIVALACVFAVVVGVIVLRFTKVIADMKQADLRGQERIIDALDRSHVQAFGDAMTALRDVQDRVVASQTSMFDRTMDMIHGPQTPLEQQATEDKPNLDMRTSWQPDDDGRDEFMYVDPTDFDVQLGIGQQVNGEPHSTMVRPGESLTP